MDLNTGPLKIHSQREKVEKDKEILWNLPDTKANIHVVQVFKNQREID